MTTETAHLPQVDAVRSTVCLCVPAARRTWRIFTLKKVSFRSALPRFKESIPSKRTHKKITSTVVLFGPTQMRCIRPHSNKPRTDDVPSRYSGTHDHTIVSDCLRRHGSVIWDTHCSARATHNSDCNTTDAHPLKTLSRSCRFLRGRTNLTKRSSRECGTGRCGRRR